MGLGHGKDEKSDVHLHSTQSSMGHYNLHSPTDFQLDFGSVTDFNAGAHDFAKLIIHDFSI